MKIETQISLDKFRVREYQWKFANSFEKKEFTKYLIVYPRRCLSGDSHIIMANGSYKLLKDIQVGDLILSWNGEKFVPDTVINHWKAGLKDTVRVSILGGPSIVSSKDHLFAYMYPYDKKVYWCKAADLHPNGFKYTHPHQVNVPWLTPEYPPEYHPLYNFCNKSIERVLVYPGENPAKSRTLWHGCDRREVYVEKWKPEILYDIETEHNHNFVANGYVVHNSGKDYIAFNLILRRALKRIGSYFYCLPTFKQARLVIWDSITMDGKRFLDCIPKDLVKRMNSQEMIIELINGSIIRMIGSDTYDTSLVGTNPVCVIFSEFALADDRAYKYVRPILNANGGSVVLLSTPRGHNSFYDLYQIAKNAPQEWYCEKLTVDDTQHIPIESIKKDIYNGEMSEELAKQEYWTDFDMGIEGSYYGRYVDKMRLEGRIGDVPWEPTYPVHISFDLGVNDSMVLIFFQVIGTVVHIIDYFEHDSEGLEYYVNYMHHKPYLYGKVIVPHDINVLEQGTGYSRYEKLSNLGVKATESPRLSLNDGIEAVRTVLPRVWIDQKNCSFLIKCLENYRREFDSLRKIYFDKPAKTQFNHGADAFRYMSISMGLLGKDSTPEEIDKRYKEVMYGPDDNLPPIFND